MASAKAGNKGDKANGAAANASDGARSPRASHPGQGLRAPEPHEPSSEGRRRAPSRVPLNSIRPGRPRSRSSEATRPHGAPEEKAAARNTVRHEKTPSKTRSTAPDPWAVPESVRARFVQDGKRWYFPDGARAFRDHGRRLSTPSENAEVIASLLEIAQARGWQAITVRGSASFRQEAWKQAKLVGLDARGYRPSAGERAAMIRRLAQEPDRAQEQRSLPLVTPEDRPKPSKMRADGEGKERASQGPEPIVGKLLDHGAEHYEFDPKADLSYFARVQTAQGVRTIWSLDLERAIHQSLSQAKIGDEVVLQHRGAKPVTVVRRERDSSGHTLSEKPVSSRRNSWSVETPRFLEQRQHAAASLRDAALSPTRVAEKHPELVGTLLQVQAAQRAARQFKHARDREDFVARVRNALADEVARGEPLRTVQLRERRAGRASPERDPAPTR